MWSQPYVLLVLTALCWGGNAIASKLAVGEVSPMAITALRWTIVVAVLALVAGRTISAELPRLRPHRLMLILMGGLGYTGFNAMFYAAGHYTSAMNIGLIQGVMPALVVLGSVLAYRTPIRLLQVAGLALALVGVAVATSRGDLAVLRDLDVNAGDALMLVASCLYAGYTVALRRKPPVAPLTFFAAMAAAALLTSLPLLAWEVASGRVVWPTGRGWLLMLFIALVPSLISQITFMRGVALIGPARAGLFTNLVPIFAALLAVVFLGEGFGPSNALALALVLSGISLAEYRPQARQP